MVCSTLRSRGGTFLLGVEFSVQCGLCKRNGHAVETHYEGRRVEGRFGQRARESPRNISNHQVRRLKSLVNVPQPTIDFGPEEGISRILGFVPFG